MNCVKLPQNALIHILPDNCDYFSGEAIMHATLDEPVYLKLHEFKSPILCMDDNKNIIIIGNSGDHESYNKTNNHDRIVFNLPKMTKIKLSTNIYVTIMKNMVAYISENTYITILKDNNITFIDHNCFDKCTEFKMNNILSLNNDISVNFLATF